MALALKEAKMTFEIPAFTFVILEYFLSYWWLWAIIALVGYILLARGESIQNSYVRALPPFEDSTQKVRGTIVYGIGWFMSLFFSCATLLSILLNILSFVT